MAIISGNSASSMTTEPTRSPASSSWLAIASAIVSAGRPNPVDGIHPMAAPSVRHRRTPTPTPPPCLAIHLPPLPGCRTPPSTPQLTDESGVAPGDSADRMHTEQRRPLVIGVAAEHDDRVQRIRTKRITLEDIGMNEIHPRGQLRHSSVGEKSIEPGIPCSGLSRKRVATRTAPIDVPAELEEVVVAADRFRAGHAPRMPVPRDVRYPRWVDPHSTLAAVKEQEVPLRLSSPKRANGTSPTIVTDEGSRCFGSRPETNRRSSDSVAEPFSRQRHIRNGVQRIRARRHRQRLPRRPLLHGLTEPPRPPPVPRGTPRTFTCASLRPRYSSARS